MHAGPKLPTLSSQSEVKSGCVGLTRFSPPHRHLVITFEDNMELRWLPGVAEKDLERRARYRGRRRASSERVTHLAFGKDAPEPRAIEPPEQGRAVALPQVGGLHHRYVRRAAPKTERMGSVGETRISAALE